MRLLSPIAFAVVALAALSACSLTSNAPPLDVAYFTVDVPQTTTTRSAELGATPVKIALGRVRSSSFLRNRIVYRQTNDALGEYERWRWTEYPEVYVRRSLAHSLFDDGRFVQSLGRDVPTLDVELIAFEEVRRNGARAARVQLAYRLHVDDRVLASDTVTVERPAPTEGGIPPVVEALERALDQATSRIAAAVASEVREALLPGRSVLRLPG